MIILLKQEIHEMMPILKSKQIQEDGAGVAGDLLYLVLG